jgi:ribulose-bisphosphate carboxylase small chain
MKTLPKERRFETFSYLPPLSGYIPGVEFNENSDPEVYYWTMWKLPLFNARSVQEVLTEVQACRSEYGNCYIRVVGFDNIKQCQSVGFIVHRPNLSRY